MPVDAAPRVLLLEDDPLDAMLFARTARRTLAEITVDTVSHPSAAPSDLTDQGYDVAFVDHRFGPFDHYGQALDLLRARGFDGPVVIVSADASDPRLRRAAASQSVLDVVDKGDLTVEVMAALLARASAARRRADAQGADGDGDGDGPA